MVESSYILLVEDDAFALQGAKMQLNKLHVPFDTATNGEDAIAKFKTKNGGITLVLMDLSMPVMDGYQSATKIREYEKSNNLTKCKIYALTGGNYHITLFIFFFANFKI